MTRAEGTEGQTFEGTLCMGAGPTGPALPRKTQERKGGRRGPGGHSNHRCPTKSVQGAGSQWTRGPPGRSKATAGNGKGEQNGLRHSGPPPGVQGVQSPRGGELAGKDFTQDILALHGPHWVSPGP